jgi:uncharacterized membrane protein
MTATTASLVDGSSTVPPARGAGRSERLLVGASALATALIAGFFYAYACSVMVGLARTDDETFVVTMQAINATVRNAGFAPSFFGALLLPAVTVLVLWRRRSPAVPWVLAALVLYAGAFAVTMGISVPLNDELAAAGSPDSIDDLAAVRAGYENPWVLWNLVRTTLSTAALVALLRALPLTGRR